MIFLFTLPTYAQQMSIMTFNTMCDFCHKNDQDTFSKRLSGLQFVVKKYNADLIALQEVRTGDQLRQITKGLKSRTIIYNTLGPFDYADPALVINTDKFEILESSFHWLGPRDGKFSFGWKWALPRQIVWAKLKNKENGMEFIFATTHLDNRNENLLGSVNTIKKLFANQKVPVILAGDTNITTEYDTYKILTADHFINGFDIQKVSAPTRSLAAQKDLCYKRKGKKFPECRVDHILLSKNSQWSVDQYEIDTQKFNSRFPSDHRAVHTIVTLKVLK